MLSIGSKTFLKQISSKHTTTKQKSILSCVAYRRGYIYGCRVGIHTNVYPNVYLHGSRSRAKLAIYMAAGCQHKIVIYSAAVQEPNRLYILLLCVLIKCYLNGSRSIANLLYTLLPGVFIKLLFTR